MVEGRLATVRRKPSVGGGGLGTHLRPLIKYLFLTGKPEPRVEELRRSGHVGAMAEG